MITHQSALKLSRIFLIFKVCSTEDWGQLCRILESWKGIRKHVCYITWHLLSANSASGAVVNELTHLIFLTTKKLGIIRIRYDPDFIDEYIEA